MYLHITCLIKDLYSEYIFLKLPKLNIKKANQFFFFFIVVGFVTH